MATQLLCDQYADALDGVLSCYDRIIVIGSLDPVSYARGMTKYLYTHTIRIFDYAQFAKPLAEDIRRTAEAIAQAHHLTIEFVRTKKLRKEDRIQAILKERGEQPGLVHIFSAMEPCGSYEPWHDKTTGKTFLKYTEAKCRHYYFYFIDEEPGLCYLRVPTWCPFRLQFYCKGHAWLASQLKRHGVDYMLQDNAFVHIADYARANELATHLDIERLHAKLDHFAAQYCPVLQTLNVTCHWSLMQVEYATDLVFKHRRTLQAFYPLLLESLIHAVKPEDSAMFLGHKLTGNYQGEVGSRFNVRVPGTRIKHAMKSAALKMYDKFGLLLRIETTVTDVSFFQQYREVQHRNGRRETQWAKMKKTIYSRESMFSSAPWATRRASKRSDGVSEIVMNLEKHVYAGHL